MDQDELLLHVTRQFERLGVLYLVTGSVATVVYGEPRFTNDVDIVAALTRATARDLPEAFPAPEYYLSEEAVEQALRNRSQFNIIHPTSGLKVDVMIWSDTPFNRGRMARARPISTAPGVEVRFASPEDVILKKMEYYREGGSEKHLRDIAGVLRVTSAIDREYLAQWAQELGVEEIWQRILIDFEGRPTPPPPPSSAQSG